MNNVLKLLTTLLFIQFSFSFEQPCDGCSNGRGVCVQESDCIIYQGQKGSAISYAGSAPNWPCPEDGNDVICCIKTVTQLLDGTSTNGRCLNINECSGTTIDTPECPGSEQVKLCVNTFGFGSKIFESKILENNKNNPFFYIAMVSIIINIIFCLNKFVF